MFVFKNLAALALLIPAFAFSAVDGVAILKKLDRNLEPESYESYRKLINIEPNGNKKEFVLYSVKKGKDQTASLFLQPASDKGRSTLRQGDMIVKTGTAQHAQTASQGGVAAAISGSKILTGHRHDSTRSKKRAIMPAIGKHGRRAGGDTDGQPRPPIRQTIRAGHRQSRTGRRGTNGCTVGAATVPPYSPQATDTLPETTLYWRNRSVG